LFEISKFGLLKGNVLVFQAGMARLSRHYKVKEMTLQVEIKTNYSFGVLVLGVIQVVAVSGKKSAKKEVG